MKQRLLSTTEDLKNYNIKKIVEVIHIEKCCPKKRISELSGLSFATVSTLCNTLIQAGVLTAVSTEFSSGGRIPEAFALSSNIWVLSVNMICSGQIFLNLSNFSNETKLLPSIQLHKQDLPEEKAQEIYNLAYSALGENPLIGVSVAFPGVYSPKSDLFANITNPLIDYHPFKKAMEELFQAPVHYNNESNLMALALSRQNPDKDNLVYLHLGEGTGTGLGLGVICSGKLLSGSHGFASEIGHMPLGTHQFPCYCGHSGCVETELTMEGFARKYLPELGQGETEVLNVWKEFESAVMEDQDKAMRVLKENGALIGRTLSVLANIFDPSAVYISGFIGQIFPYIFPFISEEINSRLTVNGYFSMPLFYCRDSERLMIDGGLETVFQDWQPLCPPPKTVHKEIRGTT